MEQVETRLQAASQVARGVLHNAAHDAHVCAIMQNIFMSPSYSFKKEWINGFDWSWPQSGFFNEFISPPNLGFQHYSSQQPWHCPLSSLHVRAHFDLYYLPSFLSHQADIPCQKHTRPSKQNSQRIGINVDGVIMHKLNRHDWSELQKRV